MRPISANLFSGYVAPPPEVQHVVEVGFFTFWLIRNTAEFNGVEGKLLYLHWTCLPVARWLFGWESFLDEKKWKTEENFKRDAVKAFNRKVREHTESS